MTSETPHPVPCPWGVCSTRPLFSYQQPLQGTSLERVMSDWDHLDHVCDWTPLRALYKLKILVGRCGELLILQRLKTSLVGKFSCLLHLPPTNLEWPAYGHSLSSAYWGRFWISPGELPRMQTNNILSFPVQKMKLKEKLHPWTGVGTGVSQLALAFPAYLAAVFSTFFYLASPEDN